MTCTFLQRIILWKTFPCGSTLLGLGLSPGFRNWVPQIGNWKISWVAYFFQGSWENSMKTTIHMYLLIEIRHDILVQCYGYYIEMKKFNFMLVINILRNSSQDNLVVLRFNFWELGWPKSGQMPCQLRLCPELVLLVLSTILEDEFMDAHARSTKRNAAKKLNASSSSAGKIGY